MSRFFRLGSDGGFYYVFDEQGRKISAGYTSRDRAIEQRDRAERRAEKQQQKIRPCITCMRSFRSEGVHNRMCSFCRGQRDPMGAPHRLPNGREARS